MLNVHTFILQYIFSGCGNEMSPEKNLHHFCFWHPSSFDFYVVILSPGTNKIFLPDRLKKKSNPAGQPSDYPASNKMAIKSKLFLFTMTVIVPLIDFSLCDDFK